MSIVNDGGPHACTRALSSGERCGAIATHKQFPVELDLRDYFAAAALTGLLAGPSEDVSNRGAAADAYRFADDMLAERKAVQK